MSKAKQKKPVGKIECCDLADKIVSLRSKGLSIKAIAKQLHKSDRYISAVVNKTGIGAPAAKKADKPSKTPPQKGVEGFEVVKIKLSDQHMKALFCATKILEIADEITRVITKALSKVS